MEPGFGKRLMHVLRAVYHMLRRGLCRKRLMMDLHLLLGRGKLASRALRDVLLAHHAHLHHAVVVRAAAAAAAGDDSSPDAAMSSSFYHHNPRDVEFSCTTTPSSSFAPGTWFRGRGRHAAGASGGYGGLDASVVARVFEMLNTTEAAATASPSMMPGATPSPLLALSLGRSPAGARQLRVTDSPFPVEPAEGVDVDGRVDDKATDFIKRFRQQLLQQPSAATPDYRG